MKKLLNIFKPKKDEMDEDDLPQMPNLEEDTCDK